MTRDEAISIMNVIVHMLEPQYDTDRIEDAVEMAIKALEQQPTDAVDRVTIKEYLYSLGMGIRVTTTDDVLGKIRAEIDEQYDRVHPYDISCAEGLEMALGIIDKYMAEGSEK